VSPYEVLEHTADIGLLARADSLESVFREASVGMLEIAGSFHPGQPGEGRPIPVSVEANDLAGVLVDWLSEVLYVQDSRGDSVAEVALDLVSETAAAGHVLVRPFAGDPSEGVQIKAVTYHQLAVERGAQGWYAKVFFDV
jgi:SHS2 domain-containing protein